LVRLYKLISALLDQICQRRRETTFILSRLAFETIVNLAYLIEYGSPELFDEYIRYSLRQERRLYDRITANIAARGGIRLPIEDRMLASISAAAIKSGFAIVDLSPNEPKSWGKRTFVSELKLSVLRPCTSLPLGEDRRTSMGIGWIYSSIILTKEVTDSRLIWTGTDRDLKLLSPSPKWLLMSSGAFLASSTYSRTCNVSIIA